MRTNLAKKLLLPVLIVSISWMLPERTLAQENAYRNGFVLGGWAGFGQVNLDSGNISRSSNGTFTLGFTGGYAITSRFVLGVEVNGWTLKSYNLEDPSQGESISNVSIGINYFPFVLPLFIDAGVGQASYTNNSPNVSGRDKGVSWFLGSGFELPINEKLVFVPQLRYSQGNFTGVDFTVVEVTLGIRWYSGKDE